MFKIKLLNFLKRIEIYFILILFFLNLYCAVALREENFVNGTYLMMSCVMLIFLNDKLIEKLDKK